MTERPAILLTVAYDGTAFSGWARQPGQRTVQGTLEEAIASMNGAPVDVRGASRTDAGVHAMGQRAAFDPARDIPEHGWLLGLNSALPDDVSVRAVSSVATGYTPRFDTVDKHYRYLVLCDEVRDPLLRQRAWHLGPRELGRHRPRALDVEAMRRAAASLVGTHDFRAFRSADDDRDNTVRTLISIDVTPGHGGDARLVALDFVGTAFMKNMVRILSGTLVEVGSGARETVSLAALLGPSAERRQAGPTAPAHGLTLVSMRLGR